MRLLNKIPKRPENLILKGKKLIYFKRLKTRYYINHLTFWTSCNDATEHYSKWVLKLTRII